MSEVYLKKKSLMPIFSVNMTANTRLNWTIEVFLFIYIFLKGLFFFFFNLQIHKDMIQETEKSH